MSDYDDIISMEHHISSKHPRMPLSARAAQFASFQALSGYGEMISETGRLTEKRPVLDENRKSVLDSRLSYIREHLSDEIKVSVTYFCPDGRKEGGSCRNIFSTVKKIDEVNREIVFSDGGLRIPADWITDLTFDFLT